MMAADSETLAQVVVGVGSLTASFMAGVVWSAYRALGWADRIRSWAQTCPVEIEAESTAVRTGELDG